MVGVRDGTKLLVMLGVISACMLAAVLTPLPGPAELRAFAEGAGPAAPLAFFAIYALCTALPLPRTVFTLASGLLFGNALGLVIALGATTASALIGFLLARRLGGDLLARHTHRGSVRAVDGLLTERGMYAVTSLRLIPVIPFAPLSYCCGVSSVGVRPFVSGTLLGSLPGTAAVVILGDALTGETPPALVAVYATCALVGALGVYSLVRQEVARARAAVAVATP